VFVLQSTAMRFASLSPLHGPRLAVQKVGGKARIVYTYLNDSISMAGSSWPSRFLSLTCRPQNVAWNRRDWIGR